MDTQADSGYIGRAELIEDMGVNAKRIPTWRHVAYRMAPAGCFQTRAFLWQEWNQRTDMRSGLISC